MSRRPALRALSDRMGIVGEYLADDGRDRRRTSDPTRVALLAAMGLDAETEEAARRSLRALEEEETGRWLDPCRVVFEDESPSVRIGPAAGRPARLELEIVEEGGAIHARAGAVPTAPGGRISGLALPALPAGIHRLRIVAPDAPSGEASQTLIVAPRRCRTVEDVLGGRRAFGLWANLYSVRTRRGTGVGDLSDLRSLVDFAAEIGGAFVGVNPLHALRNRPPDVSPYGPVSRIYRNPLYLDVEAVPELSQCAEARELLEGRSTEIERLRGADHLDYARILGCRRPVLEALYRCFVRTHRGRETERGRGYASFLARGGELLLDFATFVTLEERLVRDGREPDWRAWPAPLRDRRPSAIDEFRGKHADDIDFHAWLQFETDRQLRAVADRGRRAGLPIGLYQDLAVGSAASGFDPWAFRDLFVQGASVGAPPDVNIPTGQDWQLPPLAPRSLRESGYRYWAHLLQSSFSHAGTLRIDHVMGLFRQFWIPAGHPPRDGAYVRFPARELLAVLALESVRHGALVVGEDLGTVPRGLPSILARWGILSSRVLLFEKGKRGTFHGAARYSRRALVTANTHDLPTLAAYRSGHDLDLQRRIGLIPDDRALARAHRGRRAENRALLRRLVAEKLVPRSEEPLSYPELCRAVNAFLSRTPSPLVGLALDDLAGEEEPVNLPGVPWERHRSWTRRMQTPLEDLRSDPEVRRTIEGVAERAWRDA